jgi:hypothetical protein
MSNSMSSGGAGSGQSPLGAQEWYAAVSVATLAAFGEEDLRRLLAEALGYIGQLLEAPGQPGEVIPDETVEGELLAGLPGPHDAGDRATAEWLASPAAAGDHGWRVIGWLRRARQGRRARQPGALLDTEQREVLAEVLAEALAACSADAAAVARFLQLATDLGVEVQP